MQHAPPPMHNLNMPPHHQQYNSGMPVHGIPSTHMTGQPTFIPNPPSNQPTFTPYQQGYMPESVAHANAIQHWPTHSIYVKCLSCQRSGYSNISRNVRPLSILFVIFLFFFIFILSLLVLCCDCSYSTEHQCSHCGCHLGTSE